MGFHNKIPQTEELELKTTKPYFVTILEARKSQVNVPGDLVLGENSLLGLQTSYCVLSSARVHRDRKLWNLFL